MYLQRPCGRPAEKATREPATPEKTELLSEPVTGEKTELSTEPEMQRHRPQPSVFWMMLQSVGCVLGTDAAVVFCIRSV